jgi:N-acetylneuraminic acid mutarotase
MKQLALRFFFVAFAAGFVLQLNAQDEYVWNQKTGIPAIGRHRACGCAVGDRGYIGLGHINNSQGEIIYDDWWEYDPGTDTWMQKANFAGGVRYHAVAFAIGNFAYVGTGTSTWNDNDDLWKYNPATNQWTLVSQVPGGVRSGAVAFTINGKGYIALGDYQTDVEEYNPATNSWITKATSIVGGYSSVAAVVNGKAYVGVGSGTSWAEFDPVANSWTMKATFPGISRFGSGCFAYNGWVYVVSGSDWVNEYPDAYAYNPATNTWVQVSDFPGQARHYFVCFNIDDRVYGGTGTSGTNYNDFWEYGNLSGVEETENSQVKIFPNPVIDRAEFDFATELSANADFQLMNASGQLVREEKISSVRNWIFERGDLAAGTYFYSITSGNETKMNGKLILQ